jgi:hypothetical protein
MHWHWVPNEQIIEAVPHVVLAAVLFLVGAVFVFWGWKIYRVALALMGALIGFAIGPMIAPGLGVSAIFVSLPLAVFCAIFAIFLQKVGVFLVAGLWGAFLGFMGAAAMSQTMAVCHLAAGVAFFVVGILAVLLWRPMITFLLAMFGAGLVACAATLTADLFKPGAAGRWETAHPWLTLAAICVVAGIGLYHQEEEERAEESE